jgi:hypothetical protein
MSITISLSQESEAELQRRAAASGLNLSDYVSQLVKHFAEPPTPIEELSGPIYQTFLESGLSDDALSDELERAKDAMRADRCARG